MHILHRDVEACAREEEDYYVDGEFRVPVVANVFVVAVLVVDLHVRVDHASLNIELEVDMPDEAGARPLDFGEFLGVLVGDIGFEVVGVELDLLGFPEDLLDGLVAGEVKGLGEIGDILYGVDQVPELVIFEQVVVDQELVLDIRLLDPDNRFVVEVGE